MLWIRYAGLEAGGHDGDVAITEFSGISNDLRLDRTDRLGRDGQMAGPDYVNKRVWNITMHTLADDENGAVALAQQWERALLDPVVMRSTKLMTLEYSRNRESWYQIRGRVADYAGPDLGDYTREGAGQIDLQFEQLDPLHYSEFDERVSLLVAPGASGGLRVPVRFPVRFARSGGVRDRWATNNGENPAPVMLRFDGPMTDPVVELQGFWRFALSGTLAYDEYLIVDTRRTPASINIYSTTRPGHRAAFSWIRDGSRFSDLVIPPGQHAFSFQAVDDTYTASMTASWPHTFSSMQ